MCVCVCVTPECVFAYVGCNTMLCNYTLGSEAARAWGHGDLIEVTPSGGIVVKGRSDSALNPGGVR